MANVDVIARGLALKNQHDMQKLVIGEFGTGFITDEMLSQEGVKGQVSELSVKISELSSQLADIEQQIYEIPKGKSAYEIAVDNGFIGTEEQWLASLAQGSPEYANSIEECTDTSKLYVLPDGYLYAYMKSTTIVPTYTNLVPTATSTHGGSDVYNGLGYMNGKYVSANNTFGNDAACVATGYIPCVLDSTNAPTIYVKGITLDASVNPHCRLYFNTAAGETWEVNILADSRYYTKTEIDTNYYRFEPVMNGNNPALYLVNGKQTAFRISGVGRGENLIVTINEPIVDEEITVSQWTNTGLAYQPADYEDRIISLENKTTTLQTIVDTLSLDERGVPVYIAEEAKRVASIVQEKRTVGSITFAAMSDAHVDVETEEVWLKPNLTSIRDAGLALTELQKHVTLDFVAMLGDYTYGGGNWTTAKIKEDIQYFKNHMRNGSIGIPNIWLTGNHDINYGADSDRRMTEDELYAYITGNNVGTVQDSDNIGRNYGYIDFDNQKIRCIYLNTVDVLDYPDNIGSADVASGVTAIQTKWLADTGLNLTDKANPTEWGIIILSHHCISIFQHVTTILTAYKNGTSGSVDVTTNGVTTTVTYDFTSADRGEIICAIHGHNHNFIAKQISSEPWHQITEANAWLWSICIPNMDTTRNNEAATSTDTAWREAFGEFDINGNPVYYNKTQGTATSTSFCVITIDRKNRKIHAIAYGAGVDREISY